MSTPAVAARLAQTKDVAGLVLEAERVALAQVDDCRLQMLRLVAVACLRAELVHKRAQARIQRFRERMSMTARLRQVRIGSEMAALAGDSGTDVPALALLDGAVARVAEELAGIPESR